MTGQFSLLKSEMKAGHLHKVTELNLALDSVKVKFASKRGRGVHLIITFNVWQKELRSNDTVGNVQTMFSLTSRQ